jgi:cytochrome b6-f complex subunit 4
MSGLKVRVENGLGHNYYGEPAWPNDLLYIFPVCILGSISLVLSFGSLMPTLFVEPAEPFATPLEILPEWYFFPTFNLLRVIPNKLLGLVSMASVPLGLIAISFIEGVTPVQNPVRRPLSTIALSVGALSAIWLGLGATLPIEKAISLGIFL